MASPEGLLCVFQLTRKAELGLPSRVDWECGLRGSADFICPYNSSQLKTQMWHLLKGHHHLQDEFSVFFDHLRPAASRMGDFEEINWTEEKEYEVQAKAAGGLWGAGLMEEGRLPVCVEWHQLLPSLMALRKWHYLTWKRKKSLPRYPQRQRTREERRREPQVTRRYTGSWGCPGSPVTPRASAGMSVYCRVGPGLGSEAAAGVKARGRNVQLLARPTPRRLIRRACVQFLLAQLFLLPLGLHVFLCVHVKK